MPACLERAGAVAAAVDHECRCAHLRDHVGRIHREREFEQFCRPFHVGALALRAAEPGDRVAVTIGEEHVRECLGSHAPVRPYQRGQRAPDRGGPEIRAEHERIREHEPIDAIGMLRSETDCRGTTAGDAEQRNAVGAEVIDQITEQARFGRKRPRRDVAIRGLGRTPGTQDLSSGPRGG